MRLLRCNKIVLNNLIISRAVAMNRRLKLNGFKVASERDTQGALELHCNVFLMFAHSGVKS